jgi:hypothetical protein
VDGEEKKMTSIWLRPEARQEQRLQELIDRVAEEQKTVAFAPHLTVCSVPADLAGFDAAAAYVRGCGLLPLRVAKTAVTGAVITSFRTTIRTCKRHIAATTRRQVYRAHQASEPRHRRR